MFKKAIFASLICSFALSSQMVNAVVAVVENEPITMFELNKVKEQLKIDNKKAFDILIRDRLEQAQIRDLGIVTTPFEINQRVEQIARQNGLSVSKFRDELEFRQGINFADFKKNIEKTILQEKLYKSIFADIGKNLNENMARAYFEENKGEFATFDTIDIIIFKSSNENAIQNQIKSGTKAIKGVFVDNLSLKFENINPRLAVLLANTPQGSFTQVLKSPEGFDVFYIKDKKGFYIPKFNDVKDKVLSILYSMEQEKVALEYFDKLRAKAKIDIVRKMN